MRRRANTLMEMMISIAVIGVLVSMLVPAIQKARESANRATCANNLRQVSLGVQNYENTYRSLPPGYQEISVSSPPPGGPLWTGNTWYAFILPYIEQDSILKTYDFKAPYAAVNTTTATMIHTFTCPSDQLPQAPFQISGLNTDYNVLGAYAPCSYVGNVGSGSYTSASPLDLAPLNDGVLNIAPASPAINLVEISDGQSCTVMIGERFHFDPAFDHLGPGTTDYAIANWSAWCWVGGNQSNAADGNQGTFHVLGSAQVPLNYSVTTTAPEEKYKRLAGFGSAHSSGSQFAMCDGSVIYVRRNVDLNTLKQLCSRYDGPPTGAYE